MELNFDTLTKILSKDTNEKLDYFIEYLDCQCINYSLIDIVREMDGYNASSWHDLITSLSKDLRDYSVVVSDEDDLTNDGYDFLVLYTQYKILSDHKEVE